MNDSLNPLSHYHYYLHHDDDHPPPPLHHRDLQFLYLFFFFFCLLFFKSSINCFICHFTSSDTFLHASTSPEIPAKWYLSLVIPPPPYHFTTKSTLGVISCIRHSTAISPCWILGPYSWARCYTWLIFSHNLHCIYTINYLLITLVTFLLIVILSCKLLTQYLKLTKIKNETTIYINSGTQNQHNNQFCYQFINTVIKFLFIIFHMKYNSTQKKLRHNVT